MVSGHCPILVKLLQIESKQKNAFKYCNIWSSHSSFLQNVKDVCESLVEGYYMYSVVRKLKILKHRLSNLHRQHFHNIFEQVNNDRNKLKLVQLSFILDHYIEHCSKRKQDLEMIILDTSSH